MYISKLTYVKLLLYLIGMSHSVFLSKESSLSRERALTHTHRKSGHEVYITNTYRNRHSKLKLSNIVTKLHVNLC